LLTPLAVAVWFMDDGAADHWGVTFQTHSFEVEEVELLRAALSERFDLSTNLRGNRRRWILYVPASSMARFQGIIRPHLIEGFEHKMATRALDPVETARRPLRRRVKTQSELTGNGERSSETAIRHRGSGGQYLGKQSKGK
jgi:hypothetical protein